VQWVLVLAADPVKIDYQHQCLLLAQSGHPDTLNQCLLLGVKRTLVGR
jgi:hypothetical protein